MREPTAKTGGDPPPQAPERSATESGIARSEVERDWEGRANPLLERHPYLCGWTFLAGLLVLVFATHLTTFAVSLLFLFLISDFMTRDVRRRLRFLPKALLFSVLYLAVLAVFTVVFWKVLPDLFRRLPGVAETLQAEVIRGFEAANARWNLTSFVNPGEVRDAIVSATTKVVPRLYAGFSSFSKGFVYFLFAAVINLLLYQNLGKLDAVFARRPGSLMAFLYRFSMVRLAVFYRFFKRVMGGQIIISAVNTAISSVVIVGLGLPQQGLLVLAVFTCGLFPIIGNLVSNTILTITALLHIGPWGAVVCLGLLVGIHKLEYFLNSKIIGEIVRLPMVLTLTALIVSEVLLGIVGLILAIPLVLFIREELEQIPGLPTVRLIGANPEE